MSRGRVQGLVQASFRVPASEAWFYPSLELRTPTSWPVVVVDCDGAGGTRRLLEAMLLAYRVPLANWVVSRGTGGAHGVWCLERPVHRGARARERPLRLLARFAEWLTLEVGGDSGYAGVLTHNPVCPDPDQGLVTDWLCRAPWSLGELAGWVPRGWRRPRVAVTAVGRNVALFEEGMRWAGSAANLRLPVFEYLAAASDSVSRQLGRLPLPEAEVRGIARSVERYRDRWRAQGRFYVREERRTWGRNRGVRSGVVRRQKVEARDRAIFRDRLAGMSQREIACRHSVSRYTVRHVLARVARDASA